MIPHYWTVATQELKAGDPVMAVLADRYAGCTLVSRGDPFVTLARSIVGQQISVKAAETVWGRFSAVVGDVRPDTVLRAGNAGLSGCGLSRRKAEYLVDLARHFDEELIDASRWGGMSDEEVIASLTDVRGIGRWTAEMFLIFNLQRPDVFPLDDIGLQRAVAKLYGCPEKPGRRELAAFGERWRPWRTVATWYLWRSLDPVPVEY